MFDLVTGKARHLPSHASLPIVLSTIAQATVVTALLVIPALFVAEQLPEMPTMMAFVAPPPPPPAPPPPPMQRPAPAKPIAQAQPAASTSQLVAPVEAPKSIEPEPAGEDYLDEGVPGGVEGGVPGGIVGGVIGGLPEPPPPPPAPAVRPPVRIGGQIQTPTLVHRVEPFYPPTAVDARLQGIVILEAIVDRDGTVAEVKVLRSVNALLDREAVLAVKQWRYSPLVLNGIRERFVLTVTLTFSLEIRS
jgi:periplasmic protein TonB